MFSGLCISAAAFVGFNRITESQIYKAERSFLCRQLGSQAAAELVQTCDQDGSLVPSCLPDWKGISGLTWRG